METTVKELPDSRVRVDVDVDPEDVEGSINRTAQQLGQDMKLPGFRKGKVPPEMVVQRLGREAVLTQALESRSATGTSARCSTSGVNPVGDPKLDLSDLPDEGKPLRFSIEVAVRPERRARRVQGPRGRPRRARGARGGGRDRDRPAARGLRAAQPGRARGEAEATWC